MLMRPLSPIIHLPATCVESHGLVFFIPNLVAIPAGPDTTTLRTPEVASYVG